MGDCLFVMLNAKQITLEEMINLAKDVFSIYVHALV